MAYFHTASLVGLIEGCDGSRRIGLDEIGAHRRRTGVNSGAYRTFIYSVISDKEMHIVASVVHHPHDPPYLITRGQKKNSNALRLRHHASVELFTNVYSARPADSNDEHESKLNAESKLTGLICCLLNPS